MGLNRGWTTGALVALTLLGAACAQAPKGPAPQVDDSRGGVLVCRKSQVGLGNMTMQMVVPAGRLATVLGVAAQMGYSFSECVFAAQQTSPGADFVAVTVWTGSVAGTVWAGTSLDGDFVTWRFRAGGNVNYTTPHATFSEGTWQQQGARVTWEINNHYAEFDGTITENQLKGTGRNVRNRTWSVSLTRQLPP